MPYGTPLRNVRVADDTWHAIKTRAAREGRSVSDITRQLYRTYLEDTMTPTTEYGTWTTLVDPYSNSVERSVTDDFGDHDPTSTHDVDAIIRDYRDAINAALPRNVSLTGDEFIGPAYAADCEWDGELDIAGIVESVDLQVILARHERPET